MRPAPDQGHSMCTRNPWPGNISGHMPQDWTRREVEEAVSDYLEMLKQDLAGQKFNKTAHNRRLRETLPDRSKGSIEFKYQNISAVLLDLRHPCITGYKPRRNYQALLREVLTERLAEDHALRSLVAAIVEKPADAHPDIKDLQLVSAPRSEEPSRDTSQKRVADQPRIRSPTNYLDREARNSSLGRAGEELVLRFEHKRLWQAGKKELAERIEHVSSTKGDGLGYDILSFEESGQSRLIEVKTTRFGVYTPFFVSDNEVSVSHEHEQEYCLYRLFNFSRRPKLFLLPGAIDQSCSLQPIQYRAALR